MNISSKTTKDRVVIVVIEFFFEMYHVSNAGFGALVLTQGIAKKKSAKKAPVRIELGTSCALS